MTAILAINNAVGEITDLPEGLVFEESMGPTITQTIHSTQLIARLVTTLSDLGTLYYGRLPSFPRFVDYWLEGLKSLEHNLLKAEAKVISSARIKYHDFLFENIKNIIPAKLDPLRVREYNLEMKNLPTSVQVYLRPIITSTLSELEEHLGGSSKTPELTARTTRDINLVDPSLEVYLKKHAQYRWVRNNYFGSDSINLVMADTNDPAVLSLEIKNKTTDAIRHTSTNNFIVMKQKKIEKTAFGSKLDDLDMGSRETDGRFV